MGAGTGTPLPTSAVTGVATNNIGRYIFGRPASVSFKPTDDDGTAYAIDSGTFTVHDGDDALVSNGTVSVADGTMTAAIPATHLAKLDTYRITFTGSVDGEDHVWSASFETVGGHLFEISDLRARESSFADTALYPATELRRARIVAEERLENAAGVAFVPRGRRQTILADGHLRLVLPTPALRSIYSCKVDGVALSSDELAALVLYEDGRVERAAGWSSGSVVVIHWEHGYDAPAGPVEQAARILVRDYLVNTVVSSRAVSENVEGGFIRYAIAGRGGRTGIPEVDAVIADFGRQRPVIA